MNYAAVIGAGPAGLMAAEVMARAGVSVTVFDAKPSVARKFLMAGKSGLNLTKEEAPDMFRAAYAEARAPLDPMLAQMGPQDVINWAEGLGQPLFTGSTGRVFPVAMKASPLLRAWLGRLTDLGVNIRTRWRWAGWEKDALSFETEDGPQLVRSDATILALGGASWARLGSDGAWTSILAERDVPLRAFAPANAGVVVAWSSHMSAHLGAALKNIALTAGPWQSRGEAVISAQGLEGGGIYSVSRGVREGHPLVIDLMPDRDIAALTAAFDRAGRKATLTNRLRKAGLDAAKIALLRDMAHPLPTEFSALAHLMKTLPIRQQGLRPMDEAISTAGGIAWEGVDDQLMLKAIPGTFVAGEMLDWEAPTGGYLLTACFATGAWAGRSAAGWLRV